MALKICQANFNHIAAVSILWLLLSLSFSQSAAAQHGYPLVGSWSGEMMHADESTRVLLVLDFNIEQVISGYMIVNGNRLPLTDASLDPSSWTVDFVVQGQDRAGDPLRYEIRGSIENLGSPTERTIAGTWKGADAGGEFRVVLN